MFEKRNRGDLRGWSLVAIHQKMEFIAELVFEVVFSFAFELLKLIVVDGEAVSGSAWFSAGASLVVGVGAGFASCWWAPARFIELPLWQLAWVFAAPALTFALGSVGLTVVRRGTKVAWAAGLRMALLVAAVVVVRHLRLAS